MGDNTPWGIPDNSGAVSSLENRVRSLEIWRAECIIKERGLKIPEDGQTNTSLKNSDRPTRGSVMLPPPFCAEEFGISATAPGFDPTGEGSAYQPTEPAPGSDAEHPPLGYRLEPVGGKRKMGWIYFKFSEWHSGDKYGGIVHPGEIIANPIPAAENDSQACAECAKLRDIAKRESARADAATGRAILAERRFADLLAELSQMIEEMRG